MFFYVIIFICSLAVLLLSAKFFTNSAEGIGSWLGLQPFVIGVFIVGIGTSLPELISGILSVRNEVSEILSGNIIGANISNILLITGLVAVLNKKAITLKSQYLYIDLHFLLGSFVYFVVIAYDGTIDIIESFIGLLIFVTYAVYLIKGEAIPIEKDLKLKNKKIPYKNFIILLLSAIGIYFGADYTIFSLKNIAVELNIPTTIIALTLLSLGTTLPELAVNISAIQQGKAEMAVGNVLGSSVFNTLVIPPLSAFFGVIQVPDNLLSFSLPLMATCGLLFYLLTHDKKISIWEGLMFICLYILFLIKLVFN